MAIRCEVGQGTHHEPANRAFALASFDSRTPCTWISTGVQDRQDHDTIHFHKVEDAEWEATGQRSTDLAMDHRKPGWVFEDRMERGLENGKKLAAQAGSLLFVPIIGLTKVRFRFGAQSELHLSGVR